MSLKGALSGKTITGRINRLEILCLSAYAIAVKHGFTGTEEEWLDSLKMNVEEIREATEEYLEAHPVAIDSTLSIEGLAADAAATGAAIQQVTEAIGAHAESKDNPHGVTAAQVGLGKVDNTADKDKPVSTAQAEAISQARSGAITAAKQYADERIAAGGSSGGGILFTERTVTLSGSGWTNLAQSGSCAGMTASVPVIVAPAPDSWGSYTTAGVRCTAQSDNLLSFECDTPPEDDLVVNVLFFTQASTE